MIEADANSLSGYLKNKGSTAPAVVTTPTQPAPNPLQPINDGIGNTTDSLDKFTNLLEAVNKLLSQPLVSGLMDKGIERKSMPSEVPRDIREQKVEVPEGYNQVDNIVDSRTSNDEPKPPKEDKQVENLTAKAKLFYDALLASVKQLEKQDKDRTIESIREELEQESVELELIKQIEVIML